MLQDILSKAPERKLFSTSKEPERGRKWDHVRQSDPVIVQSSISEAASRWMRYVKSSMYGPSPDEDRKIVDNTFLEAQTPGYQRPWRGECEADEDPEKALGLRPSKRRRRIWYQKIQVGAPIIFTVLLLTYDSAICSFIHLFRFSSAWLSLQLRRSPLACHVLFTT